MKAVRGRDGRYYSQLDFEDRRPKVQKSVFVVGIDPSVSAMFHEEGWELKDDPEKASFICFTGGADIDPAIYGSVNMGSVGMNPKRDAREVAIYNRFKHEKNFLGICRGGQLLNVMAGGRMIQHIHAGGHSGINKAAHPNEYQKMPDQRNYVEIHEDHHQAMLPTHEGEVFLVALNGRVVEGVNYKRFRSLCFQPHPEWGHNKTKDLFFAYIQHYYGAPV